MSADDLNNRLSRIETHWSGLFAGSGEGPVRKQTLLRYYGAVYRYVVAMVRDGNVAEDLTQEFAVRFLSGGFRSADPDRGRFRDYLRMALRNLVRDHWDKVQRKKGREQVVADPNELPSEQESEKILDTSCREDLLARVYARMSREEKENGKPYYTFLSRKRESPDVPSAEMAVRLGQELGRPFTEENYRKTLQRSRERFEDVLFEEVGRDVESTDAERVVEELADLGLLAYCSEAGLKRLRAKP